MRVGRSTEQLIAELGTGLAAVRPLRPPVVRALLWLALAAALAALALGAMHADLALFVQRSSEPRLALEFAATLLTGIAAVLAAFHLAVPGRAGRWALAPLPPLALWLACSGLGCLRNGLGAVDGGCFVFIVGASVPLAFTLWLLLRRARPLAPLPVALTGGLGVAALGAFVLQFFHPFDVTVMDLGAHAAAVGLVVAASGFAGRRALG